jgi:predicted nucleotidyltransferase
MGQAAEEHEAEQEFRGEVADVDEATFLAVLAETAKVAEGSGVPHAFMGGIASAALGRDRWTHDIDLFVRSEDARTLLERFAEAGYQTDESDPEWLYKAVKREVLVDLIFKVTDQRMARLGAEIELDGEMLARTRRVHFKGVPLTVLGPEDLLVVKALIHKEGRARHWFDALSLVAAQDLDWDYLLRRSERDPRRVLSLLAYAQSDGLPVPDRAVRALADRAFGEPAGPGQAGQAEPAAYLVGRVQERLAQDPRTAELEVDVRLDGDVVVLSGTVATQERQAALADVVAGAVPGHQVRNLTTAGIPAAPPTVEHLP